MTSYRIWLNGKWQCDLGYDDSYADVDCETMKELLVRHDGYDPSIIVTTKEVKEPPLAQSGPAQKVGPDCEGSTPHNRGQRLTV